jgi:hypothetical protein
MPRRGLAREALSGSPDQTSPRSQQTWRAGCGQRRRPAAGSLPAGGLGLLPPAQDEHDDHAAGQQEKG